MIEYILIFLVAVLSALGLSELLHLFKVYIITPKTKQNKYMLIFLNGEAAYDNLLCAAEEQNWYGKRYSEQIIAVYFSETQEGLELCRTFARDKNIIICSITELEDIIKKIVD